MKNWYTHRDGEGTAGDNKTVADALQQLIAGLPAMFEERMKPLNDSIAEIKATKTAVTPPAATTVPADVAQQVHNLNKQIADLTKQSGEREERAKAAELKAERADKSSKLSAALGKHELNGEGAAASAYRIFESEITKNDSGDWVGPDGSPVDVYVDKQLTEFHPYFLKAREVGGAGAERVSRQRTPTINIEDIKSGMSADLKTAAYARILDLARQGQV